MKSAFGGGICRPAPARAVPRLPPGGSWRGAPEGVRRGKRLHFVMGKRRGNAFLCRRVTPSTADADAKSTRRASRPRVQIRAEARYIIRPRGGISSTPRVVYTPCEAWHLIRPFVVGMRAGRANELPSPHGLLLDIKTPRLIQFNYSSAVFVV